MHRKVKCIVKIQSNKKIYELTLLLLRYSVVLSVSYCLYPTVCILLSVSYCLYRTVWTTQCRARRYWIEGGGDRVSVHFALTFLDYWRTSFCVTIITKAADLINVNKHELVNYIVLSCQVKYFSFIQKGTYYSDIFNQIQITVFIIVVTQKTSSSVV